MKKRFIALLLTLPVIFSMGSVCWAAAGQTSEPTVLLESVEAENGTEVSVRVFIQNNPGIWGMDLRLSYDESALTLIGVENGNFFADSEWTKGNLSSHTYILSYEADGFDDVTKENGILATLRFKVSDTASEGAHTVSVAYNAGDIINVHFDEIGFSIVNGTIATKLPDVEFALGDVNGDGEINGDDVSDLSRYVAKWPGATLDSDFAADVNGDGEINGDDVSDLSRYVAKWPGAIIG